MRRINPRNNNGRIILQFTNPITKKRESISCGDWSSKKDKRYAENLAEAIYTDWLTGNFDFTLDKYRLSPKKAQEGFKSLNERITKAREISPNSQSLYTIEKFLSKFGKEVKTVPDADRFWDFISTGKKASSQKRYLNACKSHCRELFHHIELKQKIETKLVKPFTRSEIRAILKWFDRKKHVYVDYVEFLFLTGCRTGEAIGLSWKKIDWDGTLIEFSENLAVAAGSSARTNLKSTKTGKSRSFPLSGRLLEMLNYRWKMSKQEPESLVFPSHHGGAINSSSFRSNLWKPCLTELNIPYRPQYNTRHTFISHQLEQGQSPVNIASITGHNVQTLLTNYAGVINRVEVKPFF